MDQKVSCSYEESPKGKAIVHTTAQVLSSGGTHLGAWPYSVGFRSHIAEVAKPSFLLRVKV